MTSTNTYPPLSYILDDFYFSIPRERERERERSMHYSCAISFRHLSTITYIAWFCRKKFRQLDLIEEEGSGDVQLCTNFFHGSYSTNFPSALARTCRVAKNVFIILSPFEEIRNKVLSPLFFPNSRFYRIIGIIQDILTVNFLRCT